MSDPLDHLIDEMQGDSKSDLHLPDDSGLSSVARIADQIVAKQTEVKIFGRKT